MQLSAGLTASCIRYYLPTPAPSEANWQHIEAAKRQLPTFQITQEEFAAMPVWVISLERSTERRCAVAGVHVHRGDALFRGRHAAHAWHCSERLVCRRAMSASMAAIEMPFQFLPASDGAGHLSAAEARLCCCARDV